MTEATGERRPDTEPQEGHASSADHEAVPDDVATGLGDTDGSDDRGSWDDGRRDDDGSDASTAPPGADELAFDVDTLPGGALAAVEAVLAVTEEPVTAVQLATVLGLPTRRAEELLAELAAEYRGEARPGSDEGTGDWGSGDRGSGSRRPRGFELREVGGAWRLYSAGPYADVVARFVLDGQSARLTQAALETLAVVAYRQPVSRGQVSGIRGVNVDSVIRTLTTRGLVAEVGRDEPTGAVLYGTTGYFLERMGLGSLDELEPLAPYLPAMDAMAGVDDLTGE